MAFLAGGDGRQGGEKIWGMMIAAGSGLGGNDVFAGTVHGRSGGLPDYIGCKRG
jgi:hypothetical protein